MKYEIVDQNLLPSLSSNQKGEIKNKGKKKKIREDREMVHKTYVSERNC